MVDNKGNHYFPVVEGEKAMITETQSARICYKKIDASNPKHKIIHVEKVVSLPSRNEKGENTYILGIESSCDETSAAVCHNGKIVSNIIATQAIHTQYGGVVPELASRAHMQNIVPVVDQAIAEGGISLDQLDAVAFTSSPD